MPKGKTEPRGKGKTAKLPPAPAPDSETKPQRIAFNFPIDLVYRMRQRVNARKFRSGQAKDHTLTTLVVECVRTHLDALDKKEGPA